MAGSQAAASGSGRRGSRRASDSTSSLFDLSASLPEVLQPLALKPPPVIVLKTCPPPLLAW